MLYCLTQMLVMLFLKHFTQKIVNKLSKIWIWDSGSEIRDPGSGKNLFRIPDPGVKKGTGSRIRLRNTDNKLLLDVV
jgi:hypothetical protein